MVGVGALGSLVKGGYIIVVGKKQIDAIPNITTTSILILQFDPLADSHNFINVFQIEYSKIVGTQFPVYLSEHITV